MANSGLVPMLRDNKVEDLQRMYDLFSGPEKLDIVSKGMAKYVGRWGPIIVLGLTLHIAVMWFVKAKPSCLTPSARVCPLSLHATCLRCETSTCWLL